MRSQETVHWPGNRRRGSIDCFDTNDQPQIPDDASLQGADRRTGAQADLPPRALGLGLFLAPSVIFLLLTSVYPLLNSLRLSFYSWNMTIPFSKPVWFGLGNYTACCRTRPSGMLSGSRLSTSSSLSSLS